MLVLQVVNLLLTLTAIHFLRRLLRALPDLPKPNTFRMMINGVQREMTLVEAVQHWKFERAKHAKGTAMWSAYNRRLHEVGVGD